MDPLVLRGRPRKKPKKEKHKAHDFVRRWGLLLLTL